MLASGYKPDIGDKVRICVGKMGAAASKGSREFLVRYCAGIKHKVGRPLCRWCLACARLCRCSLAPATLAAKANTAEWDSIRGSLRSLCFFQEILVFEFYSCEVEYSSASVFQASHMPSRALARPVHCCEWIFVCHSWCVPRPIIG